MAAAEAGRRLTTYAMLGQLYADMGREMVTNGHAGPGDEIAADVPCVCGHRRDWHPEGTCRAGFVSAKDGCNCMGYMEAVS